MLILVTCTSTLLREQFPTCTDVHLKQSCARKIIIYEGLTTDQNNNLRKKRKPRKTIDISQNLAKILTENCYFFLESFFMFFLKLPWRKRSLKILRKIQLSRQIALPNLDSISIS